MASIRDILLKKESIEPVGQYGVPFLDDFLVGIMPEDLVIIAGGTGTGKTELAYEIAFKNSETKKVALFALEADENEPELRKLFKITAFLYFNDTMRKDINMTYRNYMTNKIDTTQYNLEACKIYESKPKPDIIYRKNEFNLDTFKQHILGNDYDLIVLDHLDYFDLNESLSENLQVSEIMKALRQVNQEKKTPIVAISHLRKTNLNIKMPSLNDLMGSSNKAKQAKTVILLAPDREDYSNNKIFSTYFSVAKSRYGTSGNLVAKMGFNIATNSYLNNYNLYKFNSFDQEFKELDVSLLPKWYKDKDKKEELF